MNGQRLRGFCLGLTLVLAAAPFAAAQLTAEEVADQTKWEEFLLTAEVVGEEQISSRKAVTSPWILTLKKGDVTHRALWKNPEGRMGGFIEGWRFEIAAYRIDKLLGLNMVPPTVERRFRENRGSCQLWIEGCRSLRDIEDNKIRLPSIKNIPYNRSLYLQRLFDNLIANEDRHKGNFLFTADWRLILIDHSRSFRTGSRYTKGLINTEKSPGGPKVVRELPRVIVEKVKALTAETVRASVGEYLNDKEVEAILLRRDLILVEIDRLIKLNGEENVLY
ncbi:MAG: hypothetical protein OEW05_08595 [Candidatus Aminicenantes bacterium]|nr:hypothetical protein [Candidatus Aminicenantes bacterium]